MTFDIGYGVQSLDELREVIDWFWAHEGRLIGFRFRDFLDFEVDQSTNGNLGTGDGSQTVFQARKQYTIASRTYQRVLNKLVSGTTRIFFDDVEQFAGFTVDVNTGEITFTPAVPDGVVVTMTTEFDVPVRFDSDVMNINLEIFNAGSVPRINLIELRIE